MSTKTIGKVTLHQNGGFVAKLQFMYENGSQWVHLDGSAGIPVAQSVTLDPGQFGVPNNGNMSVYVFVVWGADNQGKEVFTYVSGSPNVAEYTIEGTTLSNKLIYKP